MSMSPGQATQLLPIARELAGAMRERTDLQDVNSLMAEIDAGAGDETVTITVVRRSLGPDGLAVQIVQHPGDAEMRQSNGTARSRELLDVPYRVIA
jgi:hypothetical protein